MQVELLAYFIELIVLQKIHVPQNYVKNFQDWQIQELAYKYVHVGTHLSKINQNFKQIKHFNVFECGLFVVATEQPSDLTILNCLCLKSSFHRFGYIVDLISLTYQ